MTISSKIRATITFHGQPVESSIFVAGTFTHPAWDLQEMDCNTLDGTDAYFTKDIVTEQGREYYYRFKLGREGEWTVDGTKPIGTDDEGNRVNIFHAIPGDAANTMQGPIPDFGDAADMNNLHVPMDAKEEKHYQEFKAPLFAHECLGAYEISDDGPNSDNDSDESKVPRKSQPMIASVDSIDINDPTLEEFPCDRDSIMGTLRKIQSSLGDDGVVIQDGSSNGRQGSVSSQRSRSTSDPSSPSSDRRRESRSSHGSISRDKSGASLGCISE